MSMKERFGMKSRIIAGAVATFALGGAAGAGIASIGHRVEAMGPAALVPIAQLEQASRPWAGDPIVSVKGRVAGIYGHQLLLNDGSGQVLVDAGPHADTDALAQGQELTVQGGYRDGTIHARYLVNADGRVAEVGGPRAGPEHGRGPAGPEGPHGPAGPERRDSPSPPPPAAAQPQAPATAPAAAPANVAQPNPQ